MGTKIPEILTKEELIKVIKATKHKHHKIAFLLGFYQCLRISEIVGRGKPISKCCKADVDSKREEVSPGRKLMKRYCSACQKQLELPEIKLSTTE